MPRRGSSSDRRGTIMLGSGQTIRPEPRPPARAILDAMPEREFQAVHVVEGLKRRKWIVWSVPKMQMTTAGLPDILAYHPSLPGLLLAWELKTTTGRASADQKRALSHLATVPGVDARIVRPADWYALRDAIDDTSGDLTAALRAIPRGF